MRKSIFARMVPVFLGLMCLGQSAHSQGESHKDFFNPQMLWQSPGQSSIQSRAEKAVVLANRLNLRQSPKKRGKVIGTLKADQIVEVKDRQDDGWVQIKVNNNVYNVTVKKNIVHFLHAACFSPLSLVWKKTIQRGYFTTWPLLTVDMVTHYLDKSTASAKGHLNQQRQKFAHHI